MELLREVWKWATSLGPPRNSWAIIFQDHPEIYTYYQTSPNYYDAQFYLLTPMPLASCRGTETLETIPIFILCVLALIGFSQYEARDEGVGGKENRACRQWFPALPQGDHGQLYRGHRASALWATTQSQALLTQSLPLRPSSSPLLLA